jgi:ABC-type multidrug transport system permease subunit
VHTDDVTPYMISKLVAELPTTLVQCLLQYMMVKLMSGLQADFFQFVTVAFGLALVANSYGMMLGAAIPDVKDVVEAWVPLFAPQILFTGLFTRIRQIPVFLRWAQYLSAMSYALKLGYYLEFNPNQEHCMASEEAGQNCAGLLTSGGPTGEPVLWWVNVLCLFGLFMVARVLAAVALTKQAARHG